MNSHYTFPNTFEASSPDSISPPSSICGSSQDFLFAQNAPSPEFTSEFDMLRSCHQGVQQVQRTANSNSSGHHTGSDAQRPEHYGSANCSSNNSSSATDFEFINSLRSIRGTRSSPYDQDVGGHGPDSPSQPEAAVAETIVRARKSWKTVKGRSEPVWPPHLEKALVQALLQYKPHDSRYARALGRFPKRNRYISDYIFETTGVRRTPKQVGSRLQQLKDVTCGKMLLNHVASWSLEAAEGRAPNAVAGDATASPSNLHPSLSLAINGSHGHTSEGSLSPISPLSSGGVGAGDASFALRPVTKPYHNHPAFYPAAGSQTEASVPISLFDSPPLTPSIRKINVFVPFGPNCDGAVKTEGERGRPLVQFGGCLAHPETVSAPQPIDLGTTSGMEPCVTFTARDPIAAQSVTRIWLDDVSTSNGSTNWPSRSAPSPALGQGRMQSPAVRVREYSEPLICTQTPAARPSAAPTSFYPTDNMPTSGGGDGDRNCFVYATRLIDDATWRSMRKDGGLKRYSITQQLMHNFNSPGSTRGETFLLITYHFIPISPAHCTPNPLTDSILSPLDTRIHKYLRSHGYGSISPASSGSPSPVSGSPSTYIHSVNLPSPKEDNMQGSALGSFQTDGANACVPTRTQMRIPQVSVQPPPPTISASGGLINPFAQDCYSSAVSPDAFSNYDVDISGLDMVNLHLSTGSEANAAFDHSHSFL